jgi:hypothetical protein
LRTTRDGDREREGTVGDEQFTEVANEFAINPYELNSQRSPTMINRLKE